MLTFCNTRIIHILNAINLYRNVFSIKTNKALSPVINRETVLWSVYSRIWDFIWLRLHPRVNTPTQMLDKKLPARSCLFFNHQEGLRLIYKFVFIFSQQKYLNIISDGDTIMFKNRLLILMVRYACVYL